MPVSHHIHRSLLRCAFSAGTCDCHSAMDELVPVQGQNIFGENLLDRQQREEREHAAKEQELERLLAEIRQAREQRIAYKCVSSDHVSK